jgi:hypothetical protein
MQKTLPLGSQLTPDLFQKHLAYVCWHMISCLRKRVSQRVVCWPVSQVDELLGFFYAAKRRHIASKAPAHPNITAVSNATGNDVAADANASGGNGGFGGGAGNNVNGVCMAAAAILAGRPGPH